MSTSDYGDPKTRAHILDKTWKLLEDSPAQLTLAQIAQRAGVSRQAIYLHFGDRSGLLTALVGHIDESLGAEELRAHVFGAPTGVETLRRWVDAMSWYTAKIDRVTRVLEAGQFTDSAIGAALRNRLNRRQGMLLGVVERIAAEGRLAAGWTATEAAALIYSVTLPGPWRELVHEFGWSEEQYSTRIWEMFESTFLSETTDV